MSSLLRFCELRDQLAAENLSALGDLLAGRVDDMETGSQHGLWNQWMQAIAAMPEVEITDRDWNSGTVTFDGDLSDDQQRQLRASLMQLHPWRKGPFRLLGIDIDSEWRSDWKWNRLSPHLDFAGACVLDVGSGNGYYGWRMLAAGARWVLGLEPFALYIAQHQAIHRWWPDAANYVIPGSDADIPAKLDFFDIALSMGVLYHRTSPIDHLQAMFRTLRSQGTLVLETLIVDTPEATVLVPERRYAKMRNVWFLPSPGMLERFLRRVGFQNIRIVDITTTSTHEQRRTDWMTFESLSDFLAPDGKTTIEGYPLPTRAILVATKP